MREFVKISSRIGSLMFFFFMTLIVGVFAVLLLIGYYSSNLPSAAELKDYQPKTMTRLYDGSGALLAEYADEKRVSVPIDKIPPIVKNAFIAAEDQNFYSHSGIDFVSIARAVMNNVKAKIEGQGQISGASTITQQVVKNLLLTNEKTIERKIKEAILAIRMTNTLSKDRVLEIYLNEIFLGKRAYGVGAAAQNYFGKTVDELNVQEAALLAAMPKAPSAFNPSRNYERALTRRNWVINRMVDEGFVEQAEAEQALATPIEIVENGRDEKIATTHFAEEVRRKLLDKLGRETLYAGGLFVRTTMDPTLQQLAEKALYKGIKNYDRKYGWRGPIAEIKDMKKWNEELLAMEEPEGIGNWRLAVVTKTVGKKHAEIAFSPEEKSTIPFEAMAWARPNLENQRFGDLPERVSQVIRRGHVVAVSEVFDEEGKLTHHSLEQIPDVNGGLVAMDPHTGRVLAMVGGYTYGDSHFNRVTQAQRQPGSAFKPFVYMSALENGFSPASIIQDGPIEIPQGPGLPVWMPKNYSGDFLGDTSLRKGLEKSRNNMTILLALMLGIDKIQEVASRLGIMDNPLPYYSTALGAQETTLMELTAAYAALANGGKKVDPKIIDRVQDHMGKTILRSDERVCIGCDEKDNFELPIVLDDSEQLVDPIVAYQVTSMLEGVVQRGTGVKAKKIGKPLAGKTGTTNKNFDTWFMGYSPDLVVGTYIGFDQPRTLGAKATGSSVALPIWVDFMEQALAEIPSKPFNAPSGVEYVKIDKFTGKPPTEFSLPDNIDYEVMNPKAPDIAYSQEYLDYISRDVFEREVDGGSFTGGGIY